MSIRFLPLALACVLTAAAPEARGQTGACCIGGGECVETTSAECSSTYFDTFSLNGCFVAGAACDADVCADPCGACCELVEYCAHRFQSDCESITDGTFQGDGTRCVTYPCIPRPPAEPEMILAFDGTMVVSEKQRFLTFSVGDEDSPYRGRVQSVRVKITAMPDGYEDLAGTVLWVGPTTFLSSRPAWGLVDPVPDDDRNFFRVATLQCEPFFRDWTNLNSCRGGGSGVNATNCFPSDSGACGGNPELCRRDAFIHVHHPLIIPGGEYAVQILREIFDPNNEDLFSDPLALRTSRFGDVAGPFLSPEQVWSAPDGSPTVGIDVLASLDALLGKAVGPVKPRVEAAGLAGPIVDGRIAIGDVLIYIDAALGRSFASSRAAPEPVSPCP